MFLFILSISSQHRFHIIFGGISLLNILDMDCMCFVPNTQRTHFFIQCNFSRINAFLFSLWHCANFSNARLRHLEKTSTNQAISFESVHFSFVFYAIYFLLISIALFQEHTFLAESSRGCRTSDLVSPRKFNRITRPAAVEMHTLNA